MFARGFGRGVHGGRLGRFDRRHIEEERPEAKLDLLRLAGYLKPYRLQVAFTLLLSILIILLNVVPPRLIGIIVDRAVGQRDMRCLYLMASLLLAAYCASSILGGLKNFLLGRVGQRVTFDFWQDLYSSLQRLSFNYYDECQTGSLMSRMTNDVLAVERVLVDGVDTLLAASMTLAGVAFILFRLNAFLAFFTLLPIPLLFVLAWLVTVKAHKIYREVRRKMGDISALLQDNLSGIREIKSFVREDYEEKRLAEKSADYMFSSIRAIRLWSVFSPLIVTTTSLGTFLVVLVGGGMAIDGKLSPGDVVSFLLYLGLFYQPVHQLNHVNHVLQHARAASERIFEVIDAVPQVAEAKRPSPLKLPLRGWVSFRGVHFSYKPSEPVLRGVSFEARPGECVALVGATGAGKTTIVNLIPRFYDTQSGSVLVDGCDVKGVSLKELREQIGIVMQEPFLFNTTILENIAYGRLDATMSEIIEAGKLANAHEFIEQLPDGYNHQIGERGIRLSVGEKQRIAIARALLKNPPILILDEATSSVDNATEALIQEAMERLMRNRTSFVIAHRLSTVLHADTILVIESGRVAERGSHGALLGKKGIYADLYNIQWRQASPK